METPLCVLSIRITPPSWPTSPIFPPCTRPPLLSSRLNSMLTRNSRSWLSRCSKTPTNAASFSNSGQCSETIFSIVDSSCKSIISLGTLLFCLGFLQRSTMMLLCHAQIVMLTDWTDCKFAEKFSPRPSSSSFVIRFGPPSLELPLLPMTLQSARGLHSTIANWLTPHRRTWSDC
jgi:hypothetical protein